MSNKIKHYVNKFVSYVKNNRNVALAAVAVVGIVVVGGLIAAKNNPGFSMPSFLGKSDQQIGKSAVDYINNAGLSTTPASLVKVGEASGLIKVTIKIGTSTFDSYVTKDGKFLFPQAYDMSAKKATASADTGSTKKATAETLAKTDKPMLEAFVVSSCPYGLQMQRALADAVKSVPSLASNLIVRYIGSISNGQVSSMHDNAPNGGEAQENLRQICIRQEQPAKYWNYVSCYMQKASGTLPNGMPLGDSTGCLTSTGVNTGAVNSCMKDVSRGLAYAQKDFDEVTKYNVSGSPTLILGGSTISESDFGGRSSDAMKTIICDASKTKPSFCSQKLNTAEASASFSATYASASGSGGSTQCGS